MRERECFRVLLLYPNVSFMKIPPLALGLFSAILKEQGYQVELFDATCYDRPWRNDHQDRRMGSLQYRKIDMSLLNQEVRTDLLGDFETCLTRYAPDVIFVSAVEDTFPTALEMLPIARKLGVPTVVGGVFTTSAPEEALSFEPIRMIGVGEGERLIVEVCERLRSGQSLEGTPNLWVRREDGTIVKGPPAPLCDLDQAPAPDYSLFHPDRFLRPWGGKVFRTITFECVRGCPYDCTFCNSPSMNRWARANRSGPFFRRRAISRVREELRSLAASAKPEFIMFVDDTFLTRPLPELRQWCEMYAEFGIPFWLNTRADSITREKLEDLKAVGCYRLSFSVEHGNARFRAEVLKKYFPDEAVVSAGAIAAEAGIPYSVDSLIGLPYETRELLFETIELNRRIPGYDALTINIFTPYRGTELRERALAEGWLEASAFPAGLTGVSMLQMPPPYLQRQDIEGLFRTFVLYAGLPKERWDEVARAERFTDEGNQTFKRLAEEYYDGKYGPGSHTPVPPGCGGASACRAPDDG